MASAYMFSQYWPGDGVGPEAPTYTGGYASWQSSVVISSFPYAPLPKGPLFYRTRKRLGGWWERFLRWLPLRVWLLIYALRLLCTPPARLQVATRVVQGVARDPSTRRHKTWRDSDRLAVANPAMGENVHRALAARVRFKASSLEDNLLLEVAWAAVKRKRMR